MEAVNETEYGVVNNGNIELAQVNIVEIFRLLQAHAAAKNELNILLNQGRKVIAEANEAIEHLGDAKDLDGCVKKIADVENCGERLTDIGVNFQKSLAQIVLVKKQLWSRAIPVELSVLANEKN